MFSKFLCGKNEETLEALEVQWRIEYAKAKRKFEKKKQQQQKKNKTRDVAHLDSFSWMR